MLKYSAFSKYRMYGVQENESIINRRLVRTHQSPQMKAAVHIELRLFLFYIATIISTIIIFILNHAKAN